MNFLNELEERFPVGQWRIDGIHIWPMIRLELATNLTHYVMYPALYDSTNSASNVGRLPKLLFQEASGLIRYGKAFVGDFSRNAKAKRAEIVFLSDGISFSFLIDSWYEKWCDPFISKLSEENILSFMMTPTHQYRIPRRTPSRFIQPSLDWIRLKTLLSSTKQQKKRGLDRFQEFADFVGGRPLRASLPDLGSIQNQCLVVIKYAEFFERFFSEIKPRFGFLVSYYNIVGMAFNLACRRLGIVSVDIQHGLQGDLHWAYGRWRNVPEEGYEVLPRFFWVWSDVEAEAIRRWSSPHSPWHQPIAGGNLFLDIWQSSDNEMVNYYDEKIGDFKREKTGFIHILYTVGYEEADKLTMIFDAIKQSESFCWWWLRMHPGKLKEKDAFKRAIREHGLTNGEVDLATDLPLYALLRQMDLHLTFYSSSVFEAEEMGVPSVVVGVFGQELFSNQISSGWGYPANCVEEIISGIKVQFDKREELKRKKSQGTPRKRIDVMEFIRQAGVVV